MAVAEISRIICDGRLQWYVVIILKCVFYGVETMLAHEEGIPVEAELGRLSGSEVTCFFSSCGHIDVGWTRRGRKRSQDD